MYPSRTVCLAQILLQCPGVILNERIDMTESCTQCIKIECSAGQPYNFSASWCISDGCAVQQSIAAQHTLIERAREWMQIRLCTFGKEFKRYCEILR
ncbi:hypothetical protein MPTK1_5g02810 [Marchantia polymorpha subsp. ruderalis]|uniref:Uncharacterized protein n=2 Tax=Marchantia polymorpha TaxID=3197 RepID=A0AAF6BEB4_MARPO|nr:hypothetical protein MARPO_0124s0042 [Marchantia polymorpha]BBN10348.1 hypothetical protein Mp_5g02810 [Marchantia polymorpha subsp. ruderalis]|eukprot:PTQ30470.1 hypothetical protein MARPO_0124s0042 [Marchantia polymorpha]